jgi:NTE family protein
MKRLILFLLLCGTLLPAYSRDAVHPRIGLVLGGGGARGAAHVGVLKVLEEMHIPITAIAGTSMGALVGGIYASGVSPQEMQRRLTAMNWNKLFVDESPRQDWPIRRREQSLYPDFDFSVGVNKGKFQLPSGAIAGQKVQLFFSEMAKNADGVRRFDDLPIPFRAVATDLEDGGMKVFDSGPLPEVMRASMSVPGVFSPTIIDDHIYVDGGLVRNVPIDVVRRMGVDVVIAINVGSGYLPRDQLGSVLGVMGQMVAILTEQNVQRSLKELRPGKDLLITPDLGDFSSSDFDRAGDAIKIGEAAARAAAPKLRHLSVSPEAYAAWRAGRPVAVPDTAPVDEVQVVGLTWVNPAVFEPLIKEQQGQPLDMAMLDAEIERIYGRGDFQNINYHLDRSGDKNRLIVNATEKPWGPGYLRFGLGVSTDFQGDAIFGLRGTYRRTWVNSLGAEWLSTIQIGNSSELYTEFYQPFSVERSAFVVPSLGVSLTPVNVFKDGRRVARYDLTRSIFGLDFGGTLFGGNAELRIGAMLDSATFKVDTGDFNLPEGTNNETGLRASFVYDTLDSAYAPRTGTRIELNIRSPQPSMGADVSFNRAFGDWTGAHSFGANTLVGRAQLGSSFGVTMPYYDQFPLGGFMHLSGYATDEFRANQVAFGSLTYYRLLTALPPPIGRGVYFGASLEAGALQETERLLTEPGTLYGGSLFLGADTWLGPIYLGLGLSGAGDGAAYLMLGRP